MTDMLGITKRKWLAFGLFSASTTILLYFSWLMNSGSPKPLELVAFFIALTMFMAIGAMLVQKLRVSLKIGLRGRYISSIIVGCVLFALQVWGYYDRGRWVAPAETFNPVGWALNSLLAAIVFLLLYLAADFIADLFCPDRSAEKKKQKKTSAKR